jgi:flagellar hook-associated protein 2
MRIGGLASGMDIDTMVKDLMKAERMPLDKLRQKKQVLEWQRDDYRSMNTLLLNFRNELTNMRLSSTYRSRGTTSTDESKMTATATSASSLASYSISNVTQLASAATKVNAGTLSASATSKIDLNKKLSEATTDFAVPITWVSGSAISQTIQTTSDSTTAQLTLSAGSSVDTTAPMNIKVNGTAYTIVTGVPEPGKKQVSIDSSGALTFGDSVAKGSTIKVDYVSPHATDQYSSFNIKTYGPDGTERTENFNISSSDTLKTIMDKVNASNVGVTMFYDPVKDQMTLTRKETGDFNKDITGSTAGSEIITSGQFINDVLKFGTGSSETGGTNAVFNINGLVTERTSNTFEISGVTFSLKQKFSDPVSINVNNDTTQIFNNIKGFVDKYNEMIGKIQGELQEDRYKSYTPLTDEQRESLSEKQQEQWEEKAKSGMLRRDSSLTSLLTNMRTDFSNPVSNEQISPIYNQLARIGIKTSSNYQEGGKLIINEAELKKAIETDPASVEKLFNATGVTESQQGIAQRLTDTINKGLDKLRSKAGNAFTTNKQFEIGKQLDNLESRINRFEERMITVEDRYWRQFTAMEKAIQRSNEQMAQLMNYSG